MQSNVFLFRGPGIEFHRIQEGELNQFIRVGDGKNFIKEEDIEGLKGKSKVAILFGHGMLSECRGLENTNVVARINLIANQIFTASNIVFLQKKLGIQHFYLFSCFSGVVPHHLVKLKNELSDKTTITVFADDKPILGPLCEETMRKIQFFYQEHQSEEVEEIDRKFYLENVLFEAWTSVRCEITDNEGHKKFSAFKVKGPRSREDIFDENHIHKKHRLKAIINEDEIVFQRWLAQATKNEIKIDLNQYRNSAFIDSIQRGKLERIKDWINEGINVNTTASSYSGLHHASHFGYYEIAQFLIENNADIHLRTDLGFTALLFAAENGRYEIVKMLIDAGADINHQANNNVTALCLAVKGGHLEVVKTLINNGIKINSLGSCLAFYKATEKGYRELLEIFINAGIDRNFSLNGYTPLFVATLKGYTDVVELLIRNGFDVNYQSNDGTTVSHVACSEGHQKIIELFIESGAIINSRDNNGRTPLFFACNKGHKEIVEFLIKKGAAIDCSTKLETTPLIAASQNGHIEIVAILLEANANVHHQDKIGVTALNHATHKGNLEIMKLLIKAGANIDSSDNIGLTPLIIACRYGHRDIVKYLIEEGAKIDCVLTSSGLTAFQVASQFGDVEIVKMLIAAGANIDFADTKGLKALDYAKKRGREDIVDLLEETISKKRKL